MPKTLTTPTTLASPTSSTNAPSTTLKGQVLRIAALCLTLGLALLMGANYIAARSQAYEALDAQSQALARSHAAAVRDWLQAKAAIVEAVATVANTPEPEVALKRLNAAGRYVTTYLGHADKRMEFSSPQNLPPGFDPTARPWYQQAAGAQTMVLTRPYADVGGNGLVITLARAVRSGSQVQAVAAGDVSLADVTKNIASIRPTASSYGFLVGGDGAIIAHPDGQQVLKKTDALSPTLDAKALGQMAAAGGLHELLLQERPILLTVTPVEGTDWLLAVATDRQEALAGIQRLLQWSLLLGAVGLVLALGLLAVMLGRRLQRLTQVRDAMHDIGQGEGDLSRRIDAHGSDELAQIAHSFNRFAGKLAVVFGEIHQSAESVRVASEEIAHGNLDLSSRTEMTASNLQQTAASMQQLTDTVQHNADCARQANQLVGQASAVAEHGGQVVGDVVQTMEKIKQASHKIGDIIGVIDSIAFQTNILALNAAVEAARAGEQGRGFAVVASEVRALAQRSADAAREVRGLITTSVQQVDTGAQQVQEAGMTMGDIVRSVQNVRNIMGEISSATGEQSSRIAEVGQAIGQLDQMTQQNAALVEESAAAAQSLKEQSVRLSDVVGTFRG